MNTIVLGTNHNNTIGLIWSLGEAGHNVYLLLRDKGDNWVSKSRYVSRTVLIRDGDDVIRLIKRLSSDLDGKPVVFVTNDKDANLLNSNYKELSAYCYFEGNLSTDSVNLYRNKDNEEQLALICGFDIPKTFLIRNPEEIQSTSFQCPLFIKANNSINGGKAAMKKCNTISEASDFVKELPESFFPLQVQEFIEKEYEIMLLGCSLYGGNRVICPVANKKIRQYPKNTGGGSWSLSIEVATHNELKPLVAKVTHYLKEINYTGNFSAEFLYRQGKYYFLEINLRNDGTSWLSTCSGYNLPDMVARSFLSANVSSEGCVFKQRHYMNIMWDMHYLRDGTVKPIQWIKQMAGDTCFSHYNRNDKKPFWAYLRTFFCWPTCR
jgi:D-aspartate ligase